MKLYIDFEPCDECKTIMQELSSLEMAFADETIRADESAKFLRHLTYNHTEVVRGVIKDLPKQQRNQDFDFFK